MSATNRGAVRRLDDFYETPPWLTEALIPHLQPYRPHRILEPAAGGGAITRVLRRHFPGGIIVEGDIRTEQDFLTHEYAPPFDLIITNPPYSLAKEFIERALPLRSNRGAVVMLLRINFLGGQKRARFLRAFTPSIYVSPRRPSFTGGGSDATEYAWFVWDMHEPRVVILDTEHCDTTGDLFAEK